MPVPINPRSTFFFILFATKNLSEKLKLSSNGVLGGELVAALTGCTPSLLVLELNANNKVSLARIPAQTIIR